MFMELAVVAVFVLLLLLLGWASAASRPGFLDPNARPDPYVKPIPPQSRDFG
jgi:hypothetical protein